MAQRPLLFFPSKEVATKSLLRGGGGSFGLPNTQRQNERLSPSFKELLNTLNAKKTQIQSSTTGIDPEQVIIFETIGSVEDFANAVKKIEGFEWLGEIEIDEIIPDDDFYAISDKTGEKIKDKTLSGRLYMIMTNSAAMIQLLSLWNRYLQNPDKKFETGINKFRNLFKLLKIVRRWDVEDRFMETNVRRIWEEELANAPDRVIKFEIELWYRLNTDLRRKSQTSISKIIRDSGGNVLSTCDIPEINYHAILAELPAGEIKAILSNENTELIKCDNIMHFRPSGQIIMDEVAVEEVETIKTIINQKPTKGEPIIGILDGYPLSKHEVLDNRLTIDDPDNLESFYLAGERRHGTAMCSLIIRGDLSKDEAPISTPLYVRPIMRPNERDHRRLECIPNDNLLIDTIHRAVKRIYEGDGDISAVAPSIRIINLSVGDSDRIFYNSVSPWAKLLDWMSFKYGVLFVVSSGNTYNEIQLDIPQREFESLLQIDKEKIFVKQLLKNARNCRIISPAESINCITVGAIHYDNSEFRPYESRVNPYNSALPSTYTAFGGGYKRSIKPDLVYNGGRQMYEYHYTDSSILRPTKIKISPGLKVAAPNDSLRNTIYDIGTSNAAALISRNGYFCYEVLQELINDNSIDISSDKIALLIKAMLIHGCSWETLGGEIEKRLESTNGTFTKKVKSRWIGYGFPDFEKVKECTDQRATIIGYGKLNENEAHLYRLPLPPSISSQTIKRRLTITLVWFTPITANTQKYRTARLWFEAKNPLTTDRKDADWQAVMRGTNQHEIFEGSNAAAFIEGANIEIKVNCASEAAKFSESIPYAIVVSFEVAEGIDLPIYQEIKERISIPVSISQRV